MIVANCYFAIVALFHAKMILVAIDCQSDNPPGNDKGFKISAPVIYLARLFDYQHITPGIHEPYRGFEALT